MLSIISIPFITLLILYILFPGIIYYYILGLIYGLSLAVPPGPINSIIVSKSMKSNREGTLVGAGAMSADLILMLITLTLYNHIKGLPLFPFYFTGSALMIYISYGIIRSKNQEEGKVKGKGNYLLGLSSGIVNPFQIFWWLSAGLSFISVFGPLAVLGLFSGITIWIVYFPILINKGVSLNRRVGLIIKLYSVISLISFSIYFIILGTSFLIQTLQGSA